MANTSYNLLKAVSLTDYQPAFNENKNIHEWGWKELATFKRTKRRQEQMFSYVTLGVPDEIGELGSYTYYDWSENDPTTFTMTKWGYAARFSYELLKYNEHLPDIMKESGAAMGRGHAYLRDQRVARFFNRIATDTAYDGVAFAGSHTTKAGQTISNSATPASLSFDSLWTGINHFVTSVYSDEGLLVFPKPKWIMVHPQQAKTLEKILTSPWEADQADYNPNTLKNNPFLGGQLKPIYNPHMSSTTAFIILADGFKDDFIFWTVEEPTYAEQDDFDSDAMKIKSRQIFGFNCRGYRNIYYNAGA